jgi:adenine-specific DNA methylase
MTIPRTCKRLAEVDFPIAEVSRHAAREKSIRHGHPSTLHLWWARRPLASSRAVLLGLLWPDPCDPQCPESFKAKAREMLPSVQGRVGATDGDLRAALLKFIGDFANWDLATSETHLEVARALVNAAYPDELPLIVDPFAGGGSIPLEALRVGAEAFASDLNPVACLILKVLLEEIPRHGRARIRIPTADGDSEEVEWLAEAVRKVGALVKARAEKELREFYPPDADGARPIAYLWARTVRCEAPGCGAKIPLARSFWLSKKAGRQRALRHRVERPETRPPEVVFEVFEPESEVGVPKGTVSRGNATCPACGTVLRVDRVRSQLSAQRGGADVAFDERGRRVGGARLLAVVTVRRGQQGRRYRLPSERDYAAVHRAARALAECTKEPLRNGLSQVPDELLPPEGTLGFRVQKYGMRTWGDLFTARQRLALVTLAGAVRELPASAPEAVRLAMALVVDRCADRLSTVCRLDTSRDTVTNTMSRQALPIVWDFAEVNPFSDATGGLDGAVEWVAEVAQTWPGSPRGQAQIADATEYPLPDDAATIWFTDPPYYDAVPYADLSDFFFVWLRRTLPGHSLLRDPFDPANALTPKVAEIVQNEAVRLNGQVKDRVFFEDGMARAFREGRRVLQDDGIGSVVFAHKTTEGWEALLSGLIRGGWVVTASWPITTEMAARLRARDSAALAASVHLVIRPRPEDALVGDWGAVLRELPKRVGDWMGRLQSEGIRGADLVFACIGPALEIFSRYSRVETPEGREVGLPEFLEKVWEVVGRAALAQVLGTGDATARNGAAGAIEEDARLTALFLWTLQSTNGKAAGGATPESVDERPEEMDDSEDDEEAPATRQPKGPSLTFDVVRRFAQPLGIELPRWERRIIETKKGVVRLLPVAERARQLLGKDGATSIVEYLDGSPTPGELQLPLFGNEVPPRPRKGAKRGSAQMILTLEGSDVAINAATEATTLDRVHIAMLLQGAGRLSALRGLIKSEIDRGPEFLRLANALSALYPRSGEEKRLLDAMLLAVPR